MWIGRIRKHTSFVILLAVVGIGLAACSTTRDRIWLDAEGWRRAVVVGNTELPDQAPFALDNEGIAHFFVFEEIDGGYLARIFSIGRDAKIVGDHELEMFITVRPQNPGIMWDGNQLSIFWVEDHVLFTMALDEKFQGKKVSLSGDQWVSDYNVVVDSDGRLALWSSGDRTRPSIFAIDLSNPSNRSLMIDEEGYSPSMQFDSEGDLHVIWIRTFSDNTRRSVFYAEYPNGNYEDGVAKIIYTILSSSTSRVEGPKLGLDSKNAYILWSITFLSGLSAGTSSASYVYFPTGDAESISQAQDLTIPSIIDLSYSPAEDNNLLTGDRVDVSGQSLPTTTNLSEFSIKPGVANELAVSVRARLPYLRNQQRNQIGVIYLRDGSVGSYQLVSFTIANSLRPTLIQDDANQLYLSWIEAADDDFRVFYSSTSPDIKSALRSISVSEAVDIGAEMSFGIFSGLLLVYFPMMWMVVPGFLMLFTSKLRRQDEPLLSLGTIASLLLSVAAYWFFKMFFLPDILTHVPFLNYLPMLPETWHLAMRIFFPVTITLISAFVAWKYTYARRRHSPFFTLLIYMAIDSLLTMGIYGVALYGAL